MVERLQRKRDRAKHVRRPYIPKGKGPRRPGGSPAVEDKGLPLAVTRILAAIYAQEFLRWSYGYRPHRGAQDAVDKRTRKRQVGQYKAVVEADLKGCCDTSNHAWMLRMLQARLEDGACLRRIKTWLKAGVLDTDGTVLHPASGTPQGGIVSPVLANVYVH